MKLPKQCTYRPIPCPDGRTIIDELCRCGRLKTEHHALLVNQGPDLLALPGEGPLLDCPQFTFGCFVFDPAKLQSPLTKGNRLCRSGNPTHPTTGIRTRTGSFVLQRKELLERMRRIRKQSGA